MDAEPGCNQSGATRLTALKQVHDVLAGRLTPQPSEIELSEAQVTDRLVAYLRYYYRQMHSLNS